MQKEKVNAERNENKMEQVYYLVFFFLLKLQIIVIGCLLPFLSTPIFIAEANKYFVVGTS